MSVLSRRWRNVWIHVPSVDLDVSICSDVESFMDFVDIALILRSGSNLKTFSLSLSLSLSLSCCSEPVASPSYAKRWLYYEVRHFVEHVNLDLGQYLNQISHPIFTCDSLKTLELNFRFFAITLPAFINLPMLKELYLSRAIISSEGKSIQQLISFCPKIQTLDFKYCDFGKLEFLDFSGCSCLENLSIKICNIAGMKNFIPCARSLKRLVIDGFVGLWSCEMKISVPNLVYFKYVGNMISQFSVKDVSPCLDASICHSDN